MLDHRRIAFLLSVLFALAQAVPFAQSTASIHGVVFDEESTVLTGVVVTALSPALPQPLKQQTDENGRYRFPALRPGTYTISAEMPGFATVIRENIILRMGSDREVNFTLFQEVGERIVISEKRKAVETESVSTETNIDADFIKDIPLISDAYQDYAELAPGVTDSDDDGNINIRGAREESTAYLIEGLETTDPVFGGFGTNLNIDEVEEIEVQTGGISAEYGRFQGGIINILTKEGGNEFEGSLRAQLVNDSIFTGAETNPLSGTPDFKSVDGYFSLGGPIRKNTTWYYATVNWSDLTQSILAVNTSLNKPQTAEFETTIWQPSIKLTYQASPDDKLSFRAKTSDFELRNVNLSGNTDPEFGNFFQQATSNGFTRWTHVFGPNVFLESAFGVNRIDLSVGPMDPIAGVAELDLNSNQFSGSFPTQFDIDEDTYNYRSDVSIHVDDWAGTHDFKVGLNLEHDEISSRYHLGPIDVLGVASDLDGDGAEERVALRVLDLDKQLLSPQQFPLQQTRAWQDNYAAVYVQDNWKPSEKFQNLSLTLGLRWEYDEVDTTGFEPFDPALQPGLNIDSRTRQDFTISGEGFSPRFGLSWDPFRDGKTRLYASYGRYFDRFSFVGIWEQVSSTITWQGVKEGDGSKRFPPDCNLPVGNGACNGDLPFSLPSIFMTDRNIQIPYTDELQLGIEREIYPEVSLGITLISRKGKRQLQNVDLNKFIQTDGVATNPISGEPLSLLPGQPDLFVKNRNFDSIFFLTNTLNSEYESVELTLTKRLSNRWQMIANYTYGEARGLAESFFGTDVGANPATFQNEFGFLDFDQRHFLRIGGSIFLPKEQRLGYQVTWRSGLPYSNELVFNDRLFFGAGADVGFADFRLFEEGFRNGDRSPSYWLLDLRYVKDFVWKDMAVQFFLEGENILNDDPIVDQEHNVNFGLQKGDQLILPASNTRNILVQELGRIFQMGLEINF